MSKKIKRTGIRKIASYAGLFVFIGFSQLSVTEFFVFRKMESHETKNHLLCGWCSKCL